MINLLSVGVVVVFFFSSDGKFIGEYVRLNFYGRFVRGGRKLTYVEDRFEQKRMNVGKKKTQNRILIFITASKNFLS